MSLTRPVTSIQMIDQGLLGRFLDLSNWVLLFARMHGKLQEKRLLNTKPIPLNNWRNGGGKVFIWMQQ